MVMNFRLMTWVVMIVWTVASSVFMIVGVGITAMSVLVDVLVKMVMCVNVGVLMGVPHLSMRMFMSMCVDMFMPMYMLMFMYPFHGQISFHRI